MNINTDRPARGVIVSPTLHKALQGKRDEHLDDTCMVQTNNRVTLDSANHGEGSDMVQISIRNTGWSDPTHDDYHGLLEIVTTANITRRDAVYFKKFLEAFLEANPPEDDH